MSKLKERIFIGLIFLSVCSLVPVVGLHAFRSNQNNHNGKIDKPYQLKDFDKDYEDLKLQCAQDNLYQKPKMDVLKNSEKDLKILDESVLFTIESLIDKNDIELLKQKLIALQIETKIKITSSTLPGTQSSKQHIMSPLEKKDKITQSHFEDYVFNAFLTTIAFNIEDNFTSIVAGKNTSVYSAHVSTHFLPNSTTKDTTVNLNISNEKDMDQQTILYHEIVGHYGITTWDSYKRSCGYINLMKRNNYQETSIKKYLFGLLTFDQSQLLATPKSKIEGILEKNSYFKQLPSQGLRTYSMSFLYGNLEGSQIQHYNLNAIGKNVELESTMSENLAITSKTKDSVAYNAFITALEIIANKTGNSRYNSIFYHNMLLEFNREKNMDKKYIMAKEMKKFLLN